MVNTKVLLVSPQFIKQNSFIDDNVDDKDIKVSVVSVQDAEIQHLIGTALLARIYNDIIAGTLSSVYKTLVDDYLRWCTMYYALNELLDVIYFKATNKGIVNKSSDNRSEVVNFEMLDKLKEAVRNKGDWWAIRTRRFIIRNIAQIPEYIGNRNVDDIFPRANLKSVVFLYNGEIRAKFNQKNILVTQEYIQY